MNNCKHNAGTFTDQHGHERCSVCDRLMDGDTDLDNFTGSDL